MSNHNLPLFYVKANVLSDGSVIHEVYPRGSDQRLGYSDSAYKAQDLADALILAVTRWSGYLENTTDA